MTKQVDQGEGERNYHIFYFLIKGATKEEQSMFNFKNVADYGMLMHGHTAIIDNETDKDTGKNTYDEDRMNNALNPSDPDETGVRAALTMANVDETQQAGIWKVLVGLLLMGELKFKALGDDKSEVKEKDQVPVIEKYLGIEHLAENLVIFRRIIQKKALDST
jgi:myosin heavy subunit